jgi:hypothetical protein
VSCPCKRSPIEKAKHAHLPSATSNAKLARNRPHQAAGLVAIPVLKAFCPGFQGTIGEIPCRLSSQLTLPSSGWTDADPHQLGRVQTHAHWLVLLTSLPIAIAAVLEPEREGTDRH